ncbi:hypothetical protein QQ045_028171 [Rhodiola kirilowii]
MKLFWPKRLSSSATDGSSGEPKPFGGLCRKFSVNEEYKEAFRTKSYIDMCTKVQGQLSRLNVNDKFPSPSSSLVSSSSSLHLYTHFSDYLLEPQPEILAEIGTRKNVHHLLIDYFKASSEACDLCESLLRSIHQTRANYRVIKKVIKLSKRLGSCCTDAGDDTRCAPILRELGRFVLLTNPLSVINNAQYQNVHKNHKVLLDRLTFTRKKIKRRAKLTKCCKKVGGYMLVIGYSALTVALLVVLVHSMVGLLAAPGLFIGALSLFKKKIKHNIWRSMDKNWVKKLDGQLDVAAKGLYILINDLDTMSRLVRRLHDEVEHGKSIASVCVRNGKREVMDEVVKEFHAHNRLFMEQLEELEERIYLCFVTINRSRRLVMQEILTPTVQV